MTHFSELTIEVPTIERLRRDYQQLRAAFEGAGDRDQRLQVMRDWDQLRRTVDTWMSHTHLRFQQETQNEEYQKARDYCDELSPKLQELEVDWKKFLLQSSAREELEQEFGTHAFALWETDNSCFDPAIESDLVKESKLSSEYTALLASAEIDFRGEKLNFSELRKHSVSPERETRHQAEQARWSWFTTHKPELDRLYDELTNLRHQMAQKLGCNDFVELGYRRMNRLDYSRADVARFREQVRELVVPLCQELVDKQKRRLGLAELKFWDEGIHDLAGNPSPRGDHDWMLDQAQQMFNKLGGGLGEFFRMMREKELLDLRNRKGKATGGFCTSFPSEGVPFIFANFNGTKGDVEVFTHEMGHAFQCYESRTQELYDYLSPSFESCEIHSMGLEFLTWPHMELFFGDEAQRFRSIHLAESLLFLPYGVAVDHFQHEVYENPAATPEQRAQMWQRMEQMYLPWRDYGDLPHPREGRLWQAQRHIYLAPFYYIDYTLALTCALQLWVSSRKNPEQTLQTFVELCRLGGSKPFQSLAQSAGINSPFQPGCLGEVVEHARQELASFS